MKRLYLLFAAVAVCGVRSACGQSMTLAAYRDSVSSYSWQLKSAGASAAGAHETMRRSKSEMLPEISAAASASKSFHEMAGNRLWGFFIKPQVVQTVYGGGGLRAACRKAESDYRSALGDEQATRLDVRYAADYAYWNVSAMQLFMSAAEEYVSIIESLYRVVERRFGEGYIAKSDLLQVETRLSDAEYQLQTARRAYAEVLHAFNSQFGAELDRAARLAESITDTLPMPVRVTAGDMLSRRPDILAAAERVTAAEHAVDVTRAAYNPQVSIGAGGSWQTFTSPAAGRTYLDASLTMAVSVPIFRWGARRHAVSAAGAAVRGTEYALASARDAAAREEADGWSALTSSRAQMFSSLRNLKIAGENLDISTYSYNEGQATILDVLQAQLSWIQIYTNTITAQFNYAVAVSAYKRITAAD